MAEFVEALKYFERPGRRNVLSGIHERALTAPVRAENDEPRPSDSTPKKKGQTLRRSPLLVPAVVVVLLAAVTGGASLMKQTQPGSILERAEPLHSVASDVWKTALAATVEFRKSASRDFSIVLEKMRAATEDMVGERGGGTEVGAESSPSGTRLATPSPDLDPGVRAVAVWPAVFNGGGDSLETDAVETTRVVAVADPSVSAELFDGRNVDVTPPAAIRPNLPTVADDAAWNEEAGVVEAIVSARGDVERVKLLSLPESVHQAMILSAIKIWRFRPAELHGLPVRYRQLIEVAIPR